MGKNSQAKTSANAWIIGEIRIYDPVRDIDAFPGGCCFCAGIECKFRHHGDITETSRRHHGDITETLMEERVMLKQLDLGLLEKTERKPKTTLLVDTAPKYSHKTAVNNIGARIVANRMDADACMWHDVLPNLSQYSRIGFNVIYITHILNATAFMKKNGIEPLACKRSGLEIIFGGQGASPTKGCLEPLGKVFKGEYDGDIEKDGWRWRENIDTGVFWNGTRTVIELDRGCKWSCRMCSFSHVTGGPWRCKSIEQVKEQLFECAAKGLKRVTFRTANMAAYPHIDELLELCAALGVYQGWSDFSPMDYKRILPHMKALRITSPRIGVESFSENVRMDVLGSGKRFSDEYLEEMLIKLLENGANNIHLYMIFGLPEESYQNWWDWIYKLADIRDRFSHNIRWDVSICNFNPSPGTPMENARWVDFSEKERFLKLFIEHMKRSGIYAEHAKMDPQHCYGKLGRREDSYRFTMALRWAGEKLTPNIIHALPFGVRRSVAPKYIEKFFSYQTSSANSNIKPLPSDIN